MVLQVPYDLAKCPSWREAIEQGDCLELSEDLPFEVWKSINYRLH